MLLRIFRRETVGMLVGFKIDEYTSCQTSHLDLTPETTSIPNAQCMAYLPTFTPQTTQM